MLRRVVIDPNVFVSAAISSSGATATIIELIDAAGLTPIVSPHLLAELTEVLMRDKFRVYLSVETASDYVAELERLAEVWQDPRDKEAVSPDPDDDYLIALARAADADALVSGDRDLKDLRLADVRVLSPRGLLDEKPGAARPTGGANSPVLHVVAPPTRPSPVDHNRKSKRCL